MPLDIGLLQKVITESVYSRLERRYEERDYSCYEENMCGYGFLR